MCLLVAVQERRVLMVAQERDTVSAAVHAAAALLHPLRWQHIYLPLLPLALKVRMALTPHILHICKEAARLRSSPCLTA